MGEMAGVQHVSIAFRNAHVREKESPRQGPGNFHILRAVLFSSTGVGHVCFTRVRMKSHDANNVRQGTGTPNSVHPPPLPHRCGAEAPRRRRRLTRRQPAGCLPCPSNLFFCYCDWSGGPVGPRCDTLPCPPSCWRANPVLPRTYPRPGPVPRQSIFVPNLECVFGPRFFFKIVFPWTHEEGKIGFAKSHRKIFKKRPFQN